nr:barstar family protein [Amylibacter sp.]
MICDPNNLKTDFFLLRDGPVWVTSDYRLWQAGQQWLHKARGYKSHNWQLTSEAEFHEEVSKSLLWEQQFGYTHWNGNLDALNEGAASWPLADAKRLVISVENAQRLKKWFGGNTNHIWDILQDAARVQLLFSVGLLVIVYTSSDGEATRWAKVKGVSKLTRKTFPGAQLLKDAEQVC